MRKKKSDQRERARKRIIIESFIFLLIILSPFVFKIHEYFSSDPEDTINLLGFEIDRNGFANLSIYAWFILGKIVPLYLLIIWFFTCKHWWYHTILIPITMYAFQIFEVIYSEDKYVDTENLLWLLPVCMIIVPFVYFIRIKLYDKHVHGIDLEAMEAELDSYRNKKVETQGGSMEPIIEEKVYEAPEKPEFESFSEQIDRVLSTQNIEYKFRQLQRNLKNWLHPGA